MKKRKKSLFFILFILIVLISAFFIVIKSKNNSERETLVASQNYKITDDVAVLNLPPEENFSKDRQDEQPVVSALGNTEILETNQNLDMEKEKLNISSANFENEALIPSKYTCDGEDINPELKISGIPKEAQSLVLIMDDPDAPSGTWDHWIKFNMPVTAKEIKEGSFLEGISGKGTGGSLEYTGPCPPEGEHHYRFKIYALDKELTLAEGSSKKEIEEAMEGHILDEALLIGKYQRQVNLDSE